MQRMWLLSLLSNSAEHPTAMGETGRFRVLPRIASGIAVVLVAAALGGCTPQLVDDNGPPELEPIERATNNRPGAAAPEPWLCSYSPTLDRDWHNDVTCTNGVESHRPYLRGDDAYVTESEIMASAREYEDQLNSNAARAADTDPPGEGAEPTLTKVGKAKSYRSLKALVSAIRASGYDCPSWQYDEGTAHSSESGSCSEMDRFSIYANKRDVQKMIDRLAADSWSHGNVTWLVGPNWIVSVEDSDLARTSRVLKGTIVRF